MPDEKNKFRTPPAWRIDKTRYEDWKFEVQLWQKFTKTEKKQQGFAVYSILPHEKDVHDQIRLSTQNQEIKIEEDDAVTQIFKILDK